MAAGQRIVLTSSDPAMSLLRLATALIARSRHYLTSNKQRGPIGGDFADAVALP